MNSSIVFRTRFSISGRVVIQEFEIGVSLEIYLGTSESAIDKPQQVHHMPGLCDARLPDIV